MSQCLVRYVQYDTIRNVWNIDVNAGCVVWGMRAGCRMEYGGLREV